MTEYSQTTFTLNHLTCTQGEHANKTVDAAQFDALGPGYLLGPHKEFRLVKELGKGGMGVTWLAEELDSDGSKKQSVVCKILSRELINDENAVRNVLAVFDLTKELNHTHICPLLNRFQDPVFRHFLVMRYAEGETLEEWFQRQPGHENGLPAQTVLPILQQVASALDSMHVRNIIHRDVKPQNIMFSTRNTALAVPWLIDFGIAQAVNASDPEKNRSKSGTPVFMAPEQHYGKPQTARTDQYALAVTAFRLLTGRFPFTAETPEELSAKKMFPEASLPEIAPALRSTFLRALAYEPKDRFSSCADFVNALQSTQDKKKESEETFADILKEMRKKREKELAEKKKRLVDSVLKAYASEKFPFAKQLIDKLLMLDPENAYYIQFRDFIQQALDALPSVLKAGDRMVKTIDGIEYAFRWCPPGMFMMGSPEDEPGRSNNEKQHEVTLTEGFWILETQVTQKMWIGVMGSNPSDFKSPLRPVEHVSWDDCQEFCRKLSSKISAIVNLPTEAQWEYACRAGTTTALPNGPIEILGENNAPALDPIAWYGGNIGVGFELHYGWRTEWPEMQYPQTPEHPSGTHPVGRKFPNAWGFYDMLGNIWEWCLDWYGPYAESPTNDPTGPDNGLGRVHRGGWTLNARGCRSAFRNYDSPGVRGNVLGFRIVLLSFGE